jgi:hypothetical protein
MKVDVLAVGFPVTGRGTWNDGCGMLTCECLLVEGEGEPSLVRVQAQVYPPLRWISPVYSLGTMLSCDEQQRRRRDGSSDGSDAHNGDGTAHGQRPYRHVSRA